MDFKYAIMLKKSKHKLFLVGYRDGFPLFSPMCKTFKKQDALMIAGHARFPLRLVKLVDYDELYF